MDSELAECKDSVHQAKQLATPAIQAAVWSAAVGITFKVSF